MSKDLIIGTAGHIDHGKTTLIKALTGQDTDRLAEEKKRGISIELGFGYLKLNNDLKVGIIDVPGHEKFIKNMLAGAAGVDLALLVIAADEGFMAQTQEHMDILNMLNVKEGIIVISKIDLVDEEWLELVIEDVKEKVSDTFLAGVPVVKVSSVENRGLEELKKEIRKKIEVIPPKSTERNVYMPVDRVFTVQGYGTVVTGTLMDGVIKKEDKLMLYPTEINTRVRSIQVHNEQVEEALPGQRVGINLTGTDKSEVKRGDVLASPQSLQKTRILAVSLQIIPSLDFVLKHGDRIRFHLGAREVMGRVYIFNKKELFPGEKAFVQFRLEEEIVANFREHYVIRRYSPMTTIGGGIILDTKPTYYKKSKGRVLEILETFSEGNDLDIVATILQLADKESVTLNALIKKSGLSKKYLQEKLKELEQKNRIVSLNTGTDSSWIHFDNYQIVKVEIINYIKEYHRKYHLRPGVPKNEIKVKLSMKLDNTEYNVLIKKIVDEGEIIVKGSTLSLPGFIVKYKPEEKEIRDKMLKLYTENKFNPPDRNTIMNKFENKDIVEEIYASLINEDILLQISEGIFIHIDVLEEAEKMLKDFLTKNETIELGQFRDMLGSSRKYALPLLEFFDREGVTVRKGDKRELYL
ncbi:selenocysteine-specific translation elongation factor [Halocella sp. SP3-1]|uniref:selenocysteine-specific translation elongation factor n=1 Tax=Halocella sp. SP3-1 TaxID=2382161 RepID=UPI000F75878D|nr:selenocysteine-specific translation elongation factor [Halocella sp. SP3-1]AZO94731.1 selenocysteine-specific translation elongation factor [Halocella sp. SP3-1]